jgi:hypothetical protein
MNKKQINATLKKKKIEVMLKKGLRYEKSSIDGNKGTLTKKELPNPPRKSNVITTDIKVILLYSPKKKNAKITDEYSTLNPATNSASASGKSNGARLVSASIVIKKIKTKGSNGIANQQLLSCTKTISVKLADPAKIIIGIMASINEMS